VVEAERRAPRVLRVRRRPGIHRRLGTTQFSQPLVDNGCSACNPPHYAGIAAHCTGCTGAECVWLCRQRQLMQIVPAGSVPVGEEVGATECIPGGDWGTVPGCGASEEAHAATADVLYGCLSVDHPGRCDDRGDAAMVSAYILNSLIHVVGQLPD
jgi:hypothetical protein